MNIGILALQGAFAEHSKVLENLGINHFFIRSLTDLDKSFDGLILPGGESTAMGRLLLDFDLMGPLRNLILSGLPVFGTCAGMILLAKNIKGSDCAHLNTMDIEVIRNAYGRQLGSFTASSRFEDIPDVQMRFIRAPLVGNAGGNVKILSVVDQKIVAVRQDNQLAVSFHPELTCDNCIHNYFINMCRA